MPRNAEHSPNTFIASPTDCSACVSSCTPDAEWFAFFSFIFEDGGVAIFELRVHVQTGVRRALQRGPALFVKQDDILELLEWRKKRLLPDGVKFLQVTPIVAKQLVDSAIESCGQTLLDKQPWGQSWNALNACIMLLQFRHDDYAAQISTMDYRLGTSSTECFLREPAITQKMNPALRSTTQNGYKSDAEAGLGVVPLVGGAGNPTASVRTCLYIYLNWHSHARPMRVCRSSRTRQTARHRGALPQLQCARCRRHDATTLLRLFQQDHNSLATRPRRRHAAPACSC